MRCGSCPHKLAPLPAGLRVRESRDIAPDELLVLMDACGSEPAFLDSERAEQAIENSSYIVHARNANGSLIAYLSAFSDSARAVYLADLMVHPGWRRRGLGQRLMQHLEAHYAGVPVVLDADLAAQPFFEKLGYRARPAMASMVKMPGAAFSYAAGSVTASAGEPVAASAPASTSLDSPTTAVSPAPLTVPRLSTQAQAMPAAASTRASAQASTPASINAAAAIEDDTSNAQAAPLQAAQPRSGHSAGREMGRDVNRDAGRNAGRDTRHAPRP
jgi:GNAT superfamily N-acetyltransferase